MMQIKQQIKSPLYRNSLFLMANFMVTFGLAAVFWLVVARFYTEADVGLSAAIISAISLVALISRLGFDSALIRFLPKAEKPVDMINSCFTFSGITALILTGIFIVGLDLWSPALSFIRESALFSLAFAFFALCWTLSRLIDFTFIARRRAEFALTKNMVFSLLRILLPIVLVLFFHAFGIVASWGIAIGVAIAISLFFFMPRVQNPYKPAPKINLGTIKYIWRYSAGNYFANLLEAAPTLVLPVMILNLLGAEQNAYFYIAWMIALFLFSIPMAVSQSLFVEGSHFEDELGVNVRKSIRFIFLILIPAIILLFLLGKWLLLLFGEGYSMNALTLLWILGISGIPVGVNSVYMSILRVTGRIRELVIISGFITITVLLASYLIAPTTGIVGIGYIWIAAQGIVTLYVLLAIRSYFGKMQV